MYNFGSKKCMEKETRLQKRKKKPEMPKMVHPITIYWAHLELDQEFVVLFSFWKNQDFADCLLFLAVQIFTRHFFFYSAFYSAFFLLGILLGIFFIRHFIRQLGILLGIWHFYQVPIYKIGIFTR